MENYDKCLKFNQRSLQLNPDHAYALKGMGNCLVQMGRIEKGIYYLKKSIEKANQVSFRLYVLYLGIPALKV